MQVSETDQIVGRKKKPIPEGKWMPLKEVAKELKTSYYLLHYHCKAGNLKFDRKAGKRIFVRIRDVKSLLDRTKSRGVPRQVWMGDFTD